MTRTLFTAIKIALFVWFLAIMTSLVGLGSKILNVPAPTLPSVPAFSFNFEADGEYSAASKVEAGGSLTFDFGGSQTASQALSTPSLGNHTATHTVASLPKQGNSRLAGLTSNTDPGRAWFTQKGKQLPGGR